MDAGKDESNKATQANFCSRFKRTINIKEELDGEKYSYSLHSIGGKEKSLSHLLKKGIISAKSDTEVITSSSKAVNKDVDSSYQKGKLYGSYYAQVAKPPTQVKPVTQLGDNSVDMKFEPKPPEKLSLEEIKKGTCTSDPKDISDRKSKDETQPQSASPKVLKLNFKYTRSKPTAGVMSDDESDLSSIEDLQIEYINDKYKEVGTMSPNLMTSLFGCRRQPEFAKFIPVPFPIPIQMPKLELHKKSKQEWRDVQKAFEHDQACDTETSCSDTQLTAKKSDSKSGKKLRRLSRLLPKKISQSNSSSRKSTSGTQQPKRNTPQSQASAGNESASSISSFTPLRVGSKISDVDGQTKQRSNKGSQATRNGGETPGLELSKAFTIVPKFKNYQRPHRYPHYMDPRFEETTNAQLLGANIKTDPNFCATLYIELSEKPNIDLCHIQTEMAVAAMLNFFHPYNDVQCEWVKNVTEKLHELLKDKSLRAKFSTLLHLRKFEAILVLSNEAGDLLKHRNMCFLHSLASALHISPHRLLVLARNPWMTTRPTTAPA